MLKLKRVEIQGFKSFYDRTEMKFAGSGIAAVVGPNGCGKSNLSDAISWVLGEQSAKSLRGARMEDVIFAGSRDRKALGMATVTLTLIPDEAALAAGNIEIEKRKNEANDEFVGQNGHANGFVHFDLDANEFVRQKPEATRVAERAGEITITRRLYRSGESEYLINGKLARLRDIQDLFLGTGLGPESYAIIEQGRIGQILSNKPQDRRAVVEEAAGITRFKTRKRLAEAKLESAKQNLSRVYDILEEVNRQVNSLKRQAAKTKRYGELKEESTGYLRQLLGAKFRLLERDMAKTAIELNLASSELAAAQAAIVEREGEGEKLLDRSYATEAQLTEARRQLADLQLEAERARAKLEYQTRQIGNISQTLEAGEREAADLERLESESTVELETAVAELTETEGICADAAEQLAAKSAERSGAQALLTEGERTLESCRQSVLRFLGESATLKNRITQVEGQLASIDRDVTRAKNEEAQSLSDLDRLVNLRGQLSEKLSARQLELLSVAEQRKVLESEIGLNRAQLGEARQNLDRLRSEVSRVKARKDSLGEIIQHRSYTTETVKRLFTAVEKGRTEGFRPVGVLADFLEVDGRYEKATEEFLHDELEYVVVESWAEGERGIELMRGDLNGRATFFVESNGDGPLQNASIPKPDPSHALTPLPDLMRWTNGLSQFPVEQLPKIANCYVAAERELARQLAVRFPYCWFLTADGINYHGHAVSGGKKTGSGPLALKRELRDLAQLETAKSAELRAAQERLTALERTIASLGEELEQLRTQQQAQEKDALALDHESRKLAEESQRSQARLSHARLELDRIARDRVRLEETTAHDEQALAEKEEARSHAEAALESAREQIAALRDDVTRIAEEHASLRAHQASVEERRKALGGTRVRLETQVRDLINRRAHLERESEQLSGERAHLIASNTELEAKSGELNIAIVDAESAVSILAEAESRLRSALATVEEHLKRLRTEAQASGDRKSERQVDLARAESEIKHLAETAEKELESKLEQLGESLETVPALEELASLDIRYGETRRKIEGLGPINPQALEEFEEAQQRQEFLSAQRQDLLDSIRDTEKAIHEIDGESRKRFGEAFHAINANFREMFKTLFGGGVGEMRLTDEDNLSESGIDIVASPPGKRLQSVLLLSGGEKSLTAMALLMSIFQYTPSPFCILDEVDAPLDEPNIERLTRLLKEMSQETQFIVITHAKRTMEAAQSLYGVTMQEPGVSKLVSVKFKPVAQAQEERKVVQAEERQAVFA